MANVIGFIVLSLVIYLIVLIFDKAGFEILILGAVVYVIWFFARDK